MSSSDIRLLNFYIFNPTLTNKESAVSYVTKATCFAV